MNKRKSIKQTFSALMDTILGQFGTIFKLPLLFLLCYPRKGDMFIKSLLRWKHSLFSMKEQKHSSISA